MIPLAVHGWPLLSEEGGYRLGVPEFVPWPFCSVLGFFLTVCLSAVVLKTGITTCIVAGARSLSQRH